MASNVLFLTQEDQLIWNDEFQILYFYSSWTPFHQKMLLLLDKVKEKHPNIAFFAIDTDYFKVLRKRFSITSVPTTLLFQNSKEIKRIIGHAATADFIAIFDDICIFESTSTEKNYDRKESFRKTNISATKR